MPMLLSPPDPRIPKSASLAPGMPKANCLAALSISPATLPQVPGGISANYICYLEKAIQGYFGKDVVVIFLNGASGDITQVDNRSPYQNKTGERWAQFVGGRVGAEAVKVLLSVLPGTLTPIESNVKMLSIKRRAPSPERVKACLEIVEQGPKQAGQTEWTFAKEILMANAKIAKEPVAAV